MAMYITLNRRFEFCASRLLRPGGWSEDEALAWYGGDALGQYGQGRNYTAYFIFTGNVDESTGMLVNLSEIKQRVRGLIEKRFDHKNLNVDTPPFDKTPPTVELVARQLLEEVTRVFEGHPARPVACHLQETPTLAATAFANHDIEVHYTLDFSAARQTMSPNLSQEENLALFGLAAAEAGHGHHYYARITLRGGVDDVAGTVGKPSAIRRRLGELRTMLDHKHLNKDVAELSGQPMTTECLTRFLFSRLQNDFPVERVRLRENDWFFIEYAGADEFSLGISDVFSAMHRLHTDELPEDKNIELYGKCNNPRGHGHYYQVEMTLSGGLNERTGTLFPLDVVAGKFKDILALFDNKYLDQEVDPFRQIPSTGENIVIELWKRMEKEYGKKLTRVRLGETNNNRFAIRRTDDR